MSGCTRIHKSFAMIFTGMVVLCSASQVWAQEKVSIKPTQVPEAEVPKDGGFRLDVGIGLKGGLTGSWALEVPENNATRIGAESKSYYAGFGLGGDVGLAVDARALGIVGLETGLRVSFDNAKGYNELKAAGSQAILYTVNQEQKTSSLRIPLLLKLSTPNGTVRPTFSFGLEFVRQLDSSLSYDVVDGAASAPSDETARREARNQIETSNYKLLSGAFGIEIDLGPVKIPIEILAQYNLDYGGDSFDQRVRVEGTGGDATYYYNGAYQGHFGVNVGLIYDLGLFL